MAHIPPANGGGTAVHRTTERAARCRTARSCRSSYLFYLVIVPVFYLVIVPVGAEVIDVLSYPDFLAVTVSDSLCPTSFVDVL